MRRMLASNAETNVFYTGFKACDSYAGGEQAMAAVHCPTLLLVGRHDQMTPPKAARALAAHARLAKVVEVPAGHALMLEAPDQVEPPGESSLAESVSTTVDEPAQGGIFGASTLAALQGHAGNGSARPQPKPASGPLVGYGSDDDD